MQPHSAKMVPSLCRTLGEGAGLGQRVVDFLDWARDRCKFLIVSIITCRNKDYDGVFITDNF